MNKQARLLNDARAQGFSPKVLFFEDDAAHPDGVRWLGVALLGAALPLEAGEADFNEPWHPVEVDYTPIACGFDPRVQGMSIGLPRNVSGVRYETVGALGERETRWATGTPSRIRAELEASGYVVVWQD